MVGLEIVKHTGTEMTETKKLIEDHEPDFYLTPLSTYKEKRF